MLHANGVRIGERPRRWRGPGFDCEAGKGESENRDKATHCECALIGEDPFLWFVSFGPSKEMNPAAQRSEAFALVGKTAKSLDPCFRRDDALRWIPAFAE